MKPIPHPFRPAERGSALIIGLLLLLIMTIIGLSMMSSTVMEERMAGNTRERSLAFQAAEAALRDAEQQISSNTTGPYSPLQVAQFSTTCASGRCRSAPDSPKWSAMTDANWSSSQTAAYGSATGAAALAGVTTQPRYLIEYQGTQSLNPIQPGKSCDALLLITARGVGQNSNTVVFLQTVYRHHAGQCYDSI